MPRRVVCVEDEQDVIDLMRLIVERYGFEFIEARGGIKGMETVRRVKPDLVLLDLMMPGVDGWDVYDALTSEAETKDIPIVIVTARALHDARIAEMRLANAENLVTKPFGPAQLMETIERVLRSSSSERK
ncbi:MAG: response regulator [Chloroflexota bacterium]